MYKEMDEHNNTIGKSKSMSTLYELVDKVGASEIPVMILGESGSGKELIANAIHRASKRREFPIVKVNCASLNENLLENELFGHVKGAYTGANDNRMGRFELANNGTIFLDEIGDIPLSIQVKLLRVLEEKEIERLGDNRSIKVNIRIISATNKDLDKLVADKLFRKDLFFRINVFRLNVPALREHTEDIPNLVKGFMNQISKTQDRKLIISADSMTELMRRPWVGNIRELKNTIEHASVVCNDDIIRVNDFPEGLLPKNNYGDTVLFPKILPTIKQVAKELVDEAMKRTGGNQTTAAKMLGISQPALSKRISRPKNVKPIRTQCLRLVVSK